MPLEAVLGVNARRPALLGQFMPRQAEKIRRGEMEATPEALILDTINSVLDDYAFACD